MVAGPHWFCCNLCNLLLVVSGWHREHLDLQNSENTMKQPDQQIMTAWQREKLDFQNSEKTMEQPRSLDHDWMALKNGPSKNEKLEKTMEHFDERQFLSLFNSALSISEPKLRVWILSWILLVERIR